MRSAGAARRLVAALWHRRAACPTRRRSPCRVLAWVASLCSLSGELCCPPSESCAAESRLLATCSVSRRKTAGPAPDRRGISRHLPTEPHPPRRGASQLGKRGVGPACLVQHRYHTGHLVKRCRVLLRLVELRRDGERRGYLLNYRRDDRRRGACPAIGVLEQRRDIVALHIGRKERPVNGAHGHLRPLRKGRHTAR